MSHSKKDKKVFSDALHKKNFELVSSIKKISLTTRELLTASIAKKTPIKHPKIVYVHK